MATDFKSKSNTFPPAAERTLQILDRFSDTSVSLSLSDLSQSLDIPKASLYRIISCMIQYGYVMEDPQHPNYYLPGIRYMLMSRSGSVNTLLSTIAAPYMRRIVEETGQACQLTILSGFGATIIEQFVPHSTVTYIARLGEILPININASGKIMTAMMSDTEIAKFLSGAAALFRQNTPNTITDPDLFFKELEVTRARGFGTDLEEYALGIGCISVPIRYQGHVIAALGTTGEIAVYRNQKKAARLVSVLKQNSAQITKDLK